MRPQRAFRARMQRRMFLSFGVSILATILAAVGVTALFGTGGVPWHRELARMHGFLAHRFERVWDDPQARADLATAIANDLDVDVTLTDAHAKPINEVGPICHKPTLDVLVLRHDTLLGHVRVCTQRQRPWNPWRMILGLLAAGGTLWAASGLIARRLTKPLLELTRVAQDIGAGRLSSRVHFGRHRHHGELGLLADVMNDMASRIEKQMADQRALLATVSHEIRTPLARMRILVELLREKNGEDASLDSLDREVVEIDELVAELLAASRMDFSALTLKDLDATGLAKQALLRAEVSEDVLRIEGEPGAVRADPTLLVRAIANLLENAKKHAGGVERLTVSRANDTVLFVVDDAGPGLAEGEEQRIFEPFYRGRSEGTGVGLGLALVRRIAEAHGGRAYATSREGGGARIALEVSAHGPPDDVAPVATGDRRC